ncbi:MAG: hypothetical protein AAF492_12540 [Verrucomicrobiota bacterium]
MASSNILSGKAQLTVEDIAASIETAWDLQGHRGLSELKFHDNTEMLILKAAPDLLSIADQIIAQLPDGDEALIQAISSRRQNVDDPRLKYLAAAPAARLKTLESEYLQKLRESERQLEETTDQHLRKTILLEKELEKTRAEYRELERELNRTRLDLEATRKALEKSRP